MMKVMMKKTSSQCPTVSSGGNLASCRNECVCGGVIGTGSVASTPSATQLQAMDNEVNEGESEAESESGSSDRAAKRIKVWRSWPPRDVLYTVD